MITDRFYLSSPVFHPLSIPKVVFHYTETIYNLGNTKESSEKNLNMQNSNVGRNYQTLVVIWFAMLLSQITLLGVVYFARPEVYKFDFTKPVLGENAVLIIAFAFIALINLALSFVMKKRSFQQAVEKQQISYVQTGLILAYAFCEAISLLGIVLAFAFSYQYFFAWFALGILGIILHFPRRDDVVAASYKK